MRFLTTFLARLLGLAFFAIGSTFMVGAAVYLYLNPTVPPVESLRDVRLQTPLRMYSRDGVLIGEFGEKRRSPVHIQRVPRDFINAFISAEDDRFYQHPGVDITGLVRAAGQLIATGSIQTGGSTITMQVAKNYFLTKERTFARKINEIFLALDIERELSKDDILELYMNKIFLGNQAYGVEAAANVYYGISVQELSLPQMAMIAGLPKAPSRYNPIANPDRARSRRDWILGRMLKLGHITPERHQSAVSEPVTAAYHGSKMRPDAAYAAEETRRYMLKRYGREAYTEGFRVHTTVDSRLQAAATQAVLTGVVDYDSRHGFRGAEKQLQVPPDVLQTDLAPWRDVLGEFRTVAAWYPALVLEVSDRSATVLVRGEPEPVVLEWAQGLEGTARFIDPNRTSNKPESANELLNRGDIIRVKRHEDGLWHLSQLPTAQAALVSVDADSGAILAMVGGFDYKHSSFNRVSQATRQPGSNFKPFVYTAALANGFTAATVINDAPLVFDDEALESTWRPTNDSGKFDGPTRLRKALYKSRNLVSIRLLRELGFQKAIDYMDRFGFDPTALPKDLSLALGSHSLTPLQIVGGYSVFANGGFKIEPYLIDRIEDRDGITIFQTNPKIVCQRCDESDSPIGGLPTIDDHVTIEDILALDSGTSEPQYAERVLEEPVAFLIDSMLKDVVLKGTGRKARVLKRADVAGKTGTTNGPTDAWFSGYGGGIATTTWAGFDQNRELGRKEYGGSVALPIWIEFMRVALADRPERNLKQPEGIISVRIDPDTGKLARPDQANAIFEYFMADNAPTSESRDEEAREIPRKQRPDEAYEEPVEIF